MANPLAPTTLRSTIARLKGLGVELPPPVAAALAELVRIEALRPPVTEEHDLVDAYRNASLKPVDVAAVAIRIVTDATSRRAWTEACNAAAQAGVRRLGKHAADILEALRPTAERAIACLTWFAEHDSPDVSGLLNAGRTEDAQRAAAVPAAFTEWAGLTTLRASLTRPLGFDAWARGGVWTHPELVDAATVGRSLAGLDLIVTGVKAGGVLRWPTMAQAVAVAEHTTEAERVKAEELATARGY